jgi:hypothetical protein
MAARLTDLVGRSADEVRRPLPGWPEPVRV